MIHHLVLLKLKSGIGSEKVEELLRKTRINLLKIPEALVVRCGKNIDASGEWSCFFSVDFESMDRLASFRNDPIYVKYEEEVLQQITITRIALDFEMEPGKDVRYS